MADRFPEADLHLVKQPQGHQKKSILMHYGAYRTRYREGY
jgi:hypothetical protein